MSRSKKIGGVVWSEWVKYDPTSKSFLRKIKGRGVGSEVGCICGCQKKGYYYRTNTKGRLTLVHRIVLELFGIEIPEGMVVDHIDGNSLNNEITNLRVIPRPLNNKNFKMYNTNTTGVCGVRLTDCGKGNYYYSASWSDLDKKYRTKHFSISKLGIMVAFREAVIYRQKKIEELNLQGAGYSERHGKT